MKRDRWISGWCLTLIAAVAALAVPARATARIPEPASWRPLPLQARVLQAGEFGRLVPVGQTVMVEGANCWAALGDRTWAASRRDCGRFIAGAARRFRSPTSDIDGLSIAAQFASSASAHHRLAVFLERVTREFGVSGIPGAVAFSAVDDIDVAFADGDFVYLVGVRWAQGVAGHPDEAQLIEAAQSLYSRVRGRPAP
jgi:hypothetical protein